MMWENNFIAWYSFSKRVSDKTYSVPSNSSPWVYINYSFKTVLTKLFGNRRSRDGKNLITNCLGTVEVVGKDAKILITNCLETEEVEMQ